MNAFGARDMDELAKRVQPFDLEGVVKDIRCPFLIVAGERRSFGPRNAQSVYDEAKAAGVDVAIKWFSPDETGAGRPEGG